MLKALPFLFWGKRIVQRFALGIEYDGSAYHGWQRQQDGVRSIQEELEKALSQIANEPIELVGAGRTDKGVHALEQVAHFDTRAQRTTYNWRRGLNALLPKTITVRWVQEVGEKFHARFSAQRRCYRYFIHNSPDKPALFHQQLGWEYRPMKLAPMQKAADYLLGTHDFSAFRAADCQAQSPVKTLERLQVFQRGHLWMIEAQADGFLMHMVRNLTGTLVAVGTGERSPEWALEVLRSKDRRQAGIAAPAKGLFMHWVEYGPEFYLPQQRGELLFWPEGTLGK